MTRPVPNLRHDPNHVQSRRRPGTASHALANEPFVSEPFGEFDALGWPTPGAAFPQADHPNQPAHDDPRGLFLVADDDEELEDDDLFDDDDEDEDDLDDDEEDDDDDFFDDDDDDFDDDEDDDDSYFLGDDDD
ncbi:MAG: hypothetical protein AAF328_05005 [Planctomycetota bacterium]